MNTNKISVIGLGKLGSPIVASIASRGFQVIGVDVNNFFVESLNKALAPVVEPNLQDMINKYSENISATLNYSEAINNSSITFVIVPTPSIESGGFSTEFAQQAFTEIGRVIATKNDYHLVVLTSTVLPGATENDIIPAIEKASGKKCNVDFGICYNPEFIALGSVIYNLLNPDFVLIGESDRKSGDLLESFYKQYCINSPSIKRMTIINAEITKISINTYITNKISFANTLTKICDKIPGANVDIVTDAMGEDKRIGIKYLKGGLGYGGPCFPRDNRALNYVANNLGIEHILASSTDITNKKHLDFISGKIIEYAKPGDKIAVLGLSYKPNTNVIEESQSIEIVKKLISAGFDVSVYDPEAMRNAEKVFGNTVKYTTSLDEIISNKDIICLTTPWDSFKEINTKLINNNNIVIDCWRILNSEKISKINNYIPLGINK